MKHIPIQNKDYSEKVQIIKSIFNEYKKAKFQLQELPLSYNSPLVLKEESPHYGNYEHLLLNRISKMNHYQEFIDYIDFKLQYLSDTELMIILNDFMKSSNKKWWEFYFSSATYYRHKKKAIEHLIILLFS